MLCYIEHILLNMSYKNSNTCAVCVCVDYHDFWPYRYQSMYIYNCFGSTNKPIISLNSGTYSSVMNVFFCYDLPNTERTPLRLTTKMFTIEFIVLNVDYIIVNKLFEVIESN